MSPEKIIMKIRDGYTPQIVGTGFTQKQINEIEQYLELRKKRIDDYFNSIKTRLVI